MTNDIVKRNNGSLAELDADDVFKLGQVLYESKYFKDVQSAAQAIVKILRGKELGIGAIAAMENVYVIEGKTGLSYSLIGALIKRSGRYDYRVHVSTDDAAEIIFFDRGEEIGRERFDMADAKAAGLTDKRGPWQQYRQTMLFARAMSGGARKYTPDVFGGAIYTPEELRDIKDPELAIETTAQQVDTTTGEITEAKPARKPRAMPELVERYKALVAEAEEWKEQANETIAFPAFDPKWTREELQQAGTRLATELDRVKTPH